MFTPEILAVNPELILHLHQRIRRHNWLVVALSLGTLLVAIVLWGLAWVASYWLVLFGLSAAVGEEAKPPAHFNEGFLLATGLLLAIAWIDRRFTSDERATDRKSVFEIALDFVLAIPRFTISAWGNLSAWQALSEAEIAQAAALLDRIQAVRRLPVQSVPLEVPDDVTRERVVYALQLLGLIEERREDGVTWLRRIGAPDAKEPAASEPPDQKNPPLSEPGLFE